MTNFFKNVRVSCCALALIACTYANAQAAATPTPTPTPKPTATPTPVATPTPSRYAGRKLTLVTETGDFKSEFKSFLEAYDASQGNSYNQTLKKGSEIIVMNARCDDGRFGDKVTFSIYSLNQEMALLVKSYVDYRLANSMKSGDQRSRILIAEIMKILAVSTFPPEAPDFDKDDKVECDRVPVALSLSIQSLLRLEVDDAQSSLVGPKINDGFLHDAYVGNIMLMMSSMARERGFWEKFDTNRFADLQDALNASRIVAGTKVLIFNGTTFSIYRIGKFERDYKATATNAQFDVFKTTPLRKGLKIVAVVSGNEVIKIADPKAK